MSFKYELENRLIQMRQNPKTLAEENSYYIMGFGKEVRGSLDLI